MTKKLRPELSMEFEITQRGLANVRDGIWGLLKPMVEDAQASYESQSGEHLDVSRLEIDLSNPKLYAGRVYFRPKAK